MIPFLDEVHQSFCYIAMSGREWRYINSSCHLLLQKIRIQEVWRGAYILSGERKVISRVRLGEASVLN